MKRGVGFKSCWFLWKKHYCSLSQFAYHFNEIIPPNWDRVNKLRIFPIIELPNFFVGSCWKSREYSRIFFYACLNSI